MSPGNKWTDKAIAAIKIGANTNSPPTTKRPTRASIKPLTDKEEAQLLNAKSLVRMAEDRAALSDRTSKSLLAERNKLLGELENSVPIYKYADHIEKGLQRFNNHNFILGCCVGLSFSLAFIFISI